jgi:predicted amidohydrolase
MGTPQKTIEANREHGLALLDEAMTVRPDLVCLPEAFPLYSIGEPPLGERVEPLDGPTVTACAARAREHRCYVICPIKRDAGDGVFLNSAVIIGRDGGIVGVYDKVCPVTSRPDYTQFEGGITPGETFPVFDLDFGPVAMQICFDIGFPENWAALERAGARLVLWPSAAPGGFPLQCFAYIHHYWVVSSVRRGRSRIIDPVGQLLETSDESGGFAWRDVGLDYLVFHGDFNRGVGRRVAAAYGDRVAVRRWDPDSSHTNIEVLDDELSGEQIAREFGIETTRQYHDRHREALDVLRAGGQPAPQSALHGDRPQYS